MTTEQQSINEALESFPGLYLSSEAEEKIEATYGKAIAAKVSAIYDDALNCPVDWRSESLYSAQSVLEAMLDAKYPWLSAGAKGKLGQSFVYAWKQP